MIYKKLIPFLLLTALIIGGCSSKTPPAPPPSSSSDTSETSQTSQVSSAAETVVAEAQNAADVPSPAIEAGRAPEIYSYNPETEIYDRLPFETPPTTLAELAIGAANAQNTSIRLREITQQKGMIVVDFLKDSPPAVGVGSTQESAVLDSVAQTILMNHWSAEWICYRIDGKPYESGHFSWGLEEEYTPTEMRLVAHTPEAYTAIRAKLPYPGLPPTEEDMPLLVPYEDSPLVRELTHFLMLVGPPPADAPTAAALENDYILMQAFYVTPLYNCYAPLPNAPPDVTYLPEILPIALSVNDNELYLREHVEAAAKAIYGDGISLEHHDISLRKWHETEGVYTPPHTGGGARSMPAVLGYEQTGNRYTVKCAFVRQGYGISFDEESEEIAGAELSKYLQTKAQQREIVVERQPDGNLLFISHRFLPAA